MWINVEKFRQQESFTDTFIRQNDFFLDLPFLMIGQEKISFSEPIKVVSKIIFNEQEVLVEGTITGKALLVCNRCLEPFSLKLKTTFEERFVPDDYQFDLTEQDQIDEDINFFQNDQINLKPFIEQAIYLSLPMKKLCKEKCLGLCSRCGCNLNSDKCNCKDENIDPRLAVLQQLLNN